MDSRLEERLERIQSALERLRESEKIFLTLEANRKAMFSQLFLKAQGKSVAEKEANAYASADWINFMTAHVDAESDFNSDRRLYELRLKAYDAEHLTLKTEAPVIRKQGA